MKKTFTKTSLALVSALLFTPQVMAKTSPIAMQSNLDLQAVELGFVEREWIAEKVYINECAADPKYLTYWGKGEEFPSFGIGHFIWYTNQSKGRYQETFPQMFEYVASRIKGQHQPPEWLAQLEPFNAPWQNKAQFDQALKSEQLNSLRGWLQATKALQADFIVEQFQQRVTAALLAVSSAERQYYQAIINRMLNFRNGRFALIDYVNFKGIGNESEQYQGQQWGLLSVLKQMEMDLADNEAFADKQLLEKFVVAAKQRLQLRVLLAPVKRGEQRWLKGWYKRLDDYL